MDNIFGLLKENPVEPACTEKSQIHIVWTTPQPPCIQRFSTLKKGRKVYNDLRKAWEKWRLWDGEGRQPSQVFDIEGDMYDTVLDLNTVQSLSFVDIDKRMKFVPYAG